MKKTVYFFVLILITQFSCNTQKSIVNNNSQSRIHTVKEIFCNPDDKISDSIKINRNKFLSSNFDSYKIYNKSGKLTEKNFYEKDGSLNHRIIYEFDKNGKTVLAKTVNSEGNIRAECKYKYDEKGNNNVTVWYNWEGVMQSRQIDEFDKNGNVSNIVRYTPEDKIFFKYTFKYENGKKIEQQYYKSNGNVGSKRVFKYDDKGNQIELIYKQNGKDKKYTYKYDKYGNLIEENIFNSEGIIEYKTEYKFVFDNKGNWITKSEIKKNVLVSIIERKIEYY